MRLLAAIGGEHIEAKIRNCKNKEKFCVNKNCPITILSFQNGGSLRSQVKTLCMIINTSSTGGDLRAMMKSMNTGDDDDVCELQAFSKLFLFMHFELRERLSH